MRGFFSGWALPGAARFEACGGGVALREALVTGSMRGRAERWADGDRRNSTGRRRAVAPPQELARLPRGGRRARERRERNLQRTQSRCEETGRGGGEGGSHSYFAGPGCRNVAVNDDETVMDDEVNIGTDDRCLDATAQPLPRLKRPPRSLREAVNSLNRSLRDTAIGRFHSWLIQNAQPLASWPAETQTTVEQELDPPMLPMRLPARPPELFGTHRRARGRRRQRRRGLRALAWKLTEWQVASFNLFELDGAADPQVWQRRVPAYACSGQQRVYFEALFLDNLRFCRPASSAEVEAAGRGHAILRDALKKLEQLRSTSHPEHSLLPEALVGGAKEVVVDRVALCDPAGRVRPEDYLPFERGVAFADAAGRVLPPDEEPVLPKGCFMCSQKEEKALRRRLLASGMAVLMPEAEVARDRRGNLLLAGLFTVDHKKHVDRLIVDRRPQNAGERRLAWAKLPMGSQLTRIVLEPGMTLRGSGDDLRTYFYVLRNTPGAWRRNCLGRCITGDEARALGGTPVSATG